MEVNIYEELLWWYYTVLLQEMSQVLKNEKILNFFRLILNPNGFYRKNITYLSTNYLKFHNAISLEPSKEGLPHYNFSLDKCVSITK